MSRLITRGMKLNRDLRFLRRFWFILETVAACGFRELVSAYFPEHSSRKTAFRKRKKDQVSSRPVRLRRMLEELGPTFVKLGQILSTRPDIVGLEYAAELQKLTEHVTPFKFSEVRQIIEEETQLKTADIFSQLDEKPLASASIGQVHTGILKACGSKVVVKIRRPQVVETIEEDLEIMKYIASRIEEYGGEMSRIHPVRIVEEFAHSLKRELNYMVEAANLTRFAGDHQNDPHIKVPQVFFEYTTERMIVMERIEGDSAASLLEHPEKKEKYDLEQVAVNGVNSLLHQIFVSGFFHGDPHPGNIILLPENRICFIDFGMMGRVSVQERRLFLRALECILKNDIPLLVDLALKMTVSSHFSGSRSALERDAADLLDANIHLPLEKLSLARILRELLQLLNNYDLALRPDLYMMFKSLITIEQLGKVFYPGLKIFEMLKPFVSSMKVKELDPRRFLNRFISDLGENVEMFQDLPGVGCSILKKLENGDLTFNVEHHRLNDMEETLYMTGERISRALLLTALFLGSALMIVAKIPPVWEGIPLIGMGGFLISGVLSIYTLWSEHKQRLKFLRTRNIRILDEELQRKNF